MAVDDRVDFVRGAHWGRGEGKIQKRVTSESPPVSGEISFEDCTGEQTSEEHVPFVRRFESSGIRTIDGPRRSVRVGRDEEVDSGEGWERQ